jgi:hypothetical protein
LGDYNLEPRIFRVSYRQNIFQNLAKYGCVGSLAASPRDVLFGS